MAFNLNDRTQQLNQLSEFINHAKNTFQNVLNQLGWDETHLQQKEKDMVPCPLNAEHRVPQERLQQHVDSCSWRTEGYCDLDIPLPECCDTGFGSITIGKILCNAILQETAAKDPNMKLGFTGLDTRPLPKTADRLVADFTPDERCAFYDYAVAKIGAFSDSKTDLPMEFQKDDEKKEKPKTILEKLAEERDAKRRRVSYRNKKVHTNRKSQTEASQSHVRSSLLRPVKVPFFSRGISHLQQILQEVIQNQMELYEEWLKLENKDIFDTTVSEEHTNTIQPADPDQEIPSSTTVVERSRDNVDPSFENRKIPHQYFAKLRRKKGNPYALAKEISKYLESLSQSEENLDEYDIKNHNQVNIDTKTGDRNTDGYQNQNSSTSSRKDENHHRRSRAYDIERSYKKENKPYCSGKRSSPESEKHRNMEGADRYKSSKYYGRSSNTRYETCTRYSEKDRPYNPKREHQSKYESEYKRDRRSSLDTKRGDYHRARNKDQEKKYETLESRKQQSSEHPEYSSHRKRADTTTSSREKDGSAQFSKRRKEKHNECTSEKRYHMDCPEYRSKHRKHDRYKKHHSSNREKYKAYDSSESSQQNGKYSASNPNSSNESDTNKKEKCILEHHSNNKSYEDDESRSKRKRKYAHEEHVGHHKHKHKKKHKKKKKHIKLESKQESEHSSNDFSC